MQYLKTDEFSTECSENDSQNPEFSRNIFSSRLLDLFGMLNAQSCWNEETLILSTALENSKY